MILVGLTIVLLLLFQAWMVAKIDSDESDRISKDNRDDQPDEIVDKSKDTEVPPPEAVPIASGRGGKFVAGFLYGVQKESKRFYIPDSNNQFQCLQSREKISYEQVSGCYSLKRARVPW